MEARIINPFISSTVSTLKIMAGVDATKGIPFVKGSFQALADVSGVIGLAGKTSGAVVLSFPSQLARRIFEGMTGSPIQDLDADVKDVVGELANMVAGGAKAKLAEADMDFQISLPSVVFGPLHSVTTKADAPCIIIPFQAEADPFWVQVSLSRRPAPIN